MEHDYVQGLVSVIVPVFNREDLVANSIESILSQTYDRVEIIVVNDGSTDGSREVIDRYARERRSKITVIDQVNAGQVVARNNGIRHAHGEFIAFLDSDDTWAEDKLSQQIPLFSEDVGLVYSGIHEVDPDGKRLRTILCEPEMRGKIHHHLLVRNRMTGSSVVVARRALDKVGCFDESFNAAENWDLWIRISRDFTVDFVNKPLVNYLRHPGNISIDSERMLRASWSILQKHLPPDTSKGPLKDPHNHAYADYYYDIGVQHFSGGNYRQARKMFLECWKYKLLYKDSVARMMRTMLGRHANMLLASFKKRLTARNRR